MPEHRTIGQHRALVDNPEQHLSAHDRQAARLSTDDNQRVRDGNATQHLGKRGLSVDKLARFPQLGRAYKSHGAGPGRAPPAHRLLPRALSPTAGETRRG